MDEMCGPGCWGVFSCLNLSTLVAKNFGRLIFGHFFPYFGQFSDKNFGEANFRLKNIN